MNSGMRQIVSAAALATIIWPGGTPVLAQDSYWLGDRQFQIAPQHRDWDPLRREPRPVRPQVQSPRPAAPQVRVRLDPASHSAERAACLNRQLPPDTVIAACTTAIGMAQDKAE